MTEEQIKLVKPILDTIKQDYIKEFAIALLDDLPLYIWDVPASSTGKYHPEYSLGQGGLMRHQISVVRFLNFFFELEQFQNKFKPITMDLLRVAGLVHDGRKSGSQEDYERSKYTKFDHPLQMAARVREIGLNYLPEKEYEFVANCIESHMGQWCEDKKSPIVLPKPSNRYQEILHLADYLSSRKCIAMNFDGYEQPTVESPDINTYVLTFGKMKGLTLPQIKEKAPDYLQWMKGETFKEPVNSLLKQL